MTIFTRNNVVGRKCGWFFAPIHTRVTVEYDMHNPSMFLDPPNLHTQLNNVMLNPMPS